MSTQITARVPFIIGSEEVIAIVTAVYRPAVPSIWNKQVGTWEAPDPQLIEDKSLLRLDLNNEAVPCPPWLKRIILDDTSTEDALLEEASEPSDDPPERDDRP